MSEALLWCFPSSAMGAITWTPVPYAPGNAPVAVSRQAPPTLRPAPSSLLHLSDAERSLISTVMRFFSRAIPKISTTGFISTRSISLKIVRSFAVMPPASTGSKRKPADAPISPPPIKRKVASGTTSRFIQNPQLASSVFILTADRKCRRKLLHTHLPKAKRPYHLVRTSAERRHPGNSTRRPLQPRISGRGPRPEEEEGRRL